MTDSHTLPLRHDFADHTDEYQSLVDKPKQKPKKKVKWNNHLCEHKIFRKEEEINPQTDQDLNSVSSDLSENITLLREVILPKLEELFLLRRFHESLEEGLAGLNKISHPITRDVHIPWRDGNTSQLLKEAKQLKSNSFSSEERLEHVLKKLNSLYHECKEANVSEVLDDCEECVYDSSCDCVPFVCIIVQSLFELKELSTQIVMTFLWNFYGNVNSIPFKVLFLSLNGMIRRNQFEEAYNVLKYSLQPKKLPSNGQKVSSAHEASPQWKPLEIEQYEGLLEMLIFHVAPPLYKFDEAFEMLESDRFLPDWKIEAFRAQLNIIKQEMKVPEIKPIRNIPPPPEPLSNPEIRKDEEPIIVPSPRQANNQKGAITTASYLAQLHRTVNFIWTLIKGRLSSKWTAASAFALLVFLVSLRARSQTELRPTGGYNYKKRSVNTIPSRSLFGGILELFSSLFSVGSAL